MTDIQELAKRLDGWNRNKFLMDRGYRHSKNHYISPHTGELVSQESALEMERTLCTTQTDQPT